LAIIRPGRNSRVLRIEKSIEIGSPVAEVFHAWATWKIAVSDPSGPEDHSLGGRFHGEIEMRAALPWDAIVYAIYPE